MKLQFSDGATPKITTLPAGVESFFEISPARLGGPVVGDGSLYKCYETLGTKAYIIREIIASITT